MPQGDLVLRTAQEIAKGAHQTAMDLGGFSQTYSNQFLQGQWRGHLCRAKLARSQKSGDAVDLEVLLVSRDFDPD